VTPFLFYFMGSWSVSCGISNIAITSGHKCVLLPIKKHKGEYLDYIPACIPIFGEYDDYGGIEDIEKNENTKLIEEHFGVTIEEFCQFLVDGKFTYGREEAEEVSEQLAEKGTLEECKEWRFMWIDRQVYDFMAIKSHVSWGGEGDFDIGKKELLEYLGFEYIGENTKNPVYDNKRFKYEWKYQDRLFYSDGTWLHCGSESVYRFSQLQKHVTIPEDKLCLQNKTKDQIWRILNPKKAKEMFWILGKERGYSDFDDLFTVEYLEQALKDFNEEDDKLDMRGWYKEKIAELKLTDIVGKYVKNINVFGDSVAELCTLRRNLHPMSGQFLPHTLYLTPQCGEFKEHQKLLEKFAEINKGYVTEYDDDDLED
jgi:hypothetical protein